MQIATVTGFVSPAELGKTLMHEHLMVAMAGWELDAPAPGQSWREMVEICCDRIAELQAAGYRTLIDPCPNDVGRDVNLMAEVAARTGFNIIAATGLYNEVLGGNAYWRIKAMRHPDFIDQLADLMVRELTEGVGDSGIRAGVIKLGTGPEPITDYETKVFTAGARASLATGAPITTHSDAVHGDAQVRLLTSLGVPAHKIIVGHSCGNPDHAYHMGIVASGAYVGFDRFGLERICPDEVRTRSLLRVIGAGALRQVIVSHDSVWCHRGQSAPEGLLATPGPLHFERVIAPQLRAAGVSAADLDTLLVTNPRRYFSGEAPAP